jgi:hypothetical protein
MTREKLARTFALLSKGLKRNGKPGTRMVQTGAKLSILAPVERPSRKAAFFTLFFKGF